MWKANKCGGKRARELPPDLPKNWQVILLFIRIEIGCNCTIQLTSFLHKNFYIFNSNFFILLIYFFNLTVENKSYFNLNPSLQLYQVQYPKYYTESQSLFVVTQYKYLFNSTRKTINFFTCILYCVIVYHRKTISHSYMPLQHS